MAQWRRHRPTELGTQKEVPAAGRDKLPADTRAMGVAMTCAHPSLPKARHYKIDCFEGINHKVCRRHVNTDLLSSIVF